MRVPIGDWQFWIATALSLLAAWWLLRAILPRWLGGTRHRRRARRTTLTVAGKPVRK